MFKIYKEIMTIAQLAHTERDTTDLIFSVSHHGERNYYEFDEFMKLSEGGNRNNMIKLCFIAQYICLIVSHNRSHDGMAFVMTHKKNLVEYPIANISAIQSYAQRCATLDESSIRDCCTHISELCEAAQDLWIEPDLNKKLPSRFHAWTDDPKIYIRIFTNEYVDEYRRRAIMRRDGLI